VRPATETFLAQLAGTLIVSCQARAGDPFAELGHIVALAESAQLGGAAGLRVDGADAVRACIVATGLPVIGIRKVEVAESRPAITPRLADFIELAAAGASAIAFDASRQYQPDDGHLAGLLARAHGELDVPLMADVSTIQEARRAMACGADLVATTLWGYTPETRDAEGPAIELAREISDDGIPVVVEGRVGSPTDVSRAFDAGAVAVVVGSAITNPVHLTRLFRAATPSVQLSPEGVASGG
jgi:N-acylglucosamine-6-phosphate 2-epimerase